MNARTPLPLLSQASRPLTFDVTAVNENGETLPISIAGEHPLTLYLDKREIVTLMTIGARPEALAIGYLRNQRLVDSLSDIAAVQVDWDVEAVAVTTRHGTDVAGRVERRTITTGCGQGTVFGGILDDLDQVRLPGDVRFDRERLQVLLEAVRNEQTIYKQAGAVHGCALASNDAAGVRVLMFVEDVGRHNAVDAIAGQMWLDGLEGDDKVFYTTGRLTSEMVMKTAQMGIPFLVSRSGLTQMGWEIAQRTGITAIGRALGRHYLVYTGLERFRR